MLHGYAEAGSAFASTHEERAAEPLEWWQRRIADPSGLTAGFGAWMDDQLVGALALEFNTGTRTAQNAQLLGMYVHPDHRGLGTGRRLVDAAIAHCEARRTIRAIKLSATEGNAAAIRLYEAAGFVIFGVEPLALRTGDVFRSDVWMWREVTPAP
jgi:ribosomal protein S18 acetylase RimI-like enzyme